MCSNKACDIDSKGCGTQEFSSKKRNRAAEENSHVRNPSNKKVSHQAIDLTGQHELTDDQFGCFDSSYDLMISQVYSSDGQLDEIGIQNMRRAKYFLCKNLLSASTIDFSNHVCRCIRFSLCRRQLCERTYVG